MKNSISFLGGIYKKFDEHDGLGLSGELTYKLLLSLFPFLIFLISIIGFLNLDTTELLASINGSAMPDAVKSIIQTFIHEVVDVQNGTVLTLSGIWQEPEPKLWTKVEPKRSRSRK